MNNASGEPGWHFPGAATPVVLDETSAAPLRWISLRVEFAVLFVGLPAILVAVRYGGGTVPIIPTLIVVAGLSAWILWRTRAFDRCSLAWKCGQGREIVRIALTALPCFAALWWLTSQLRPELLFDLPMRRTRFWAFLMVVYPLLSVLPQELVYRAFFFHRYRRLFASRTSLVVCSSVLFGLAHLIFGNSIAVLLSTIGGLMFGWTYLRTRSLLLVSIEHALYGCFLFSVGLHSYFYCS